jgi:hypothetical protein
MSDSHSAQVVNLSPGTPAALQAFFHELRKSMIFFRSRLKTQGESGQNSSRSFFAARRRSRMSPFKIGTEHPFTILRLIWF